MDPNRACEDLTPNLGRPNDLAMKRGELERPRSSIHVMEKLQQSPDKIVQLTCFPPLIGWSSDRVRLVQISLAAVFFGYLHRFATKASTFLFRIFAT